MDGIYSITWLFNKYFQVNHYESRISIIQKNQPFFIPEFSDEIHYELELILKFSKVGKHIDKDFCLNYISHFSLGIDFTARDLQNDLKLKGLP